MTAPANNQPAPTNQAPTDQQGQQTGQQGQPPQQVQQQAPTGGQQGNQWSGLLDPGQQQGQPVQGQPGQQQGPWPYQLPQFPPQSWQQGQPGQGQPVQPGQPVFGQPTPQSTDPNHIADLVARTVTSQIDRVINAARNPQYQQAHGQPAGHPGQQGQPPQQWPQQPPVPTGPSDGDLREGRIAAREYLNGQMALGSVDEQAIAADLAAAMLPNLLMRGYTPDQAGREVAGQVAQRIKGLRGTYEQQMIHALRSRGALKEDQQTPAGLAPNAVGIPAGGQPASVAAAANMQQKSAWMADLAKQENKARGWNQTAPAAAGG